MSSGPAGNDWTVRRQEAMMCGAENENIYSRPGELIAYNFM